MDLSLASKLELDHAVHVRSYPGSPRGGDAGWVIPFEDGALAVLLDASGHGLAAYAVAQKARTAIHENARLEPDALLTLLDKTLKGTVGASVSIALVRGNTLHFAGVGNVSARIDAYSMNVKVGVVGTRMRQPEMIAMPFPANAWLIMHSDGVSSPDFIPPGSAKTIVRTLVEHRGSEHDDASAIALRWQHKV